MAVKARTELTLASVSDGKPGSNGVGIKSTAISYQAGASQTKPPTGSWTAEPPKLSTALPYLWTKTYITYTDGKTSTSYSVSSTLDGVEVGGRNLLHETNEGDKHWGIAKGDGEATKVSKLYADIKNANGVRFDIVKASTNWSFISFADSALVDTLLATPGESYTISFDIKTDFSDSLGIDIMNGNGLNRIIDFGTFMLVANKWNHVVQTGKVLTSAIKSAQVIYLNTFPLQAKGAKFFEIANLKLERGNKATDWTPAPEDIQQGIDDAQNSANDANNKVDNITDTVTKTSAELKVLSDSISSLVTDAKGQSLMTQTGSGWTFNIGSIQSALNGAIGDIQDVKGDISGINDLANKTNELANDVAKKTAYINMTQDESGQPVMELGQQNGEFKLRITNTSMDFMQGSQKIAYLSNRQLYIQSSVVTDEMKIGATSGYIWKKRANGNMGLRYVSGGGSV